MVGAVMDMLTVARRFGSASSEGSREGRQVGHLGNGGCTEECADPTGGGNRVAVLGAVEGGDGGGPVRKGEGGEIGVERRGAGAVGDKYGASKVVGDGEGGDDGESGGKPGERGGRVRMRTCPIDARERGVVGEKMGCNGIVGW